VIVKIVTFFLIGIAVLALFGRLRWPGGAGRIGRDGRAGRPRLGRGERPPKPKKCPHCGTFRVGSGPCPCGKG